MNSTQFVFYSLLAVIIMGTFMFFASYKSKMGKNIIINLEMASSPEKVKSLLEGASPDSIKWLRINTYCDFLFIISYASLFFFSTRWLIIYFNVENSLHVLPYIWIIPGVCDIIENIFLFHFFNLNYCEPLFKFYMTVVRIKWGMSYLGMGMVLSVLILIIIRYFRSLK